MRQARQYSQQSFGLKMVISVQLYGELRSSIQAAIFFWSFSLSQCLNWPSQKSQDRVCANIKCSLTIHTSMQICRRICSSVKA